MRHMTFPKLLGDIYKVEGTKTRYENAVVAYKSVVEKASNTLILSVYEYVHV
jgi:hypothetical protein